MDTSNIPPNDLARVISISRERATDAIELLLNKGRDVTKDEVDIIYDEIYSALLDYINQSNTGI